MGITVKLRTVIGAAMGSTFGTKIKAEIGIKMMALISKRNQPQASS